MSQIVFNSLTTQPNPPATGKVTFFALSSDKRIYMEDEFGVITPLTDVGGPQKNYLINGDFSIAQRQVLTTLATYNSATTRPYAHDQWSVTNQTASVQIRSVDSIASIEAGLLARYYAKLVQITGAGKLVYSQVIEGTQGAPLRGRIVRLQAKMKFSVAAAMTVRLGLLQLNSTGTVDSVPGGVLSGGSFITGLGAGGTDPTWGTGLVLITPTAVENAVISNSAATCALTSGWVRYSAVFTLPSNYVNLVPVIWSNAQMAVADELNIAEVGLYDGADVVTAWNPVSYTDNLSQCQRHYFKTFRPLIAPAQNAGASSGAFEFPATSVGAATNRAYLRLPVPMRTTSAVITGFNPSAANAQARDETAAADCAGTAQTSTSDAAVRITATGAAGTVAGDLLSLHLTVDASL